MPWVQPPSAPASNIHYILCTGSLLHALGAASLCLPLTYILCTGSLLHAVGAASLCLPTFLPASNFTLYLPIFRDAYKESQS